MVSSRALVYALALAEMGTGAWSLLLGGTIAGWAMAILYAAFGLFVAFALHRRIPIASCGCFGKVDTPPSPLHLLLNAAGFGAGLWAALNHTPAIASVLAGQPMAGLPYLGLLAAGTYAAFLLLTALPSVLGAHPAGHR